MTNFPFPFENDIFGQTNESESDIDDYNLYFHANLNQVLSQNATLIQLQFLTLI